MVHPLPNHARLVANPEVWLESAAIEQLAQAASLPGCVQAVGMPDLHPGRGIPIGAAFLFEGCVRPRLVGGDAGCGVLLVATNVEGPTGDALERRIRDALEVPVVPDAIREAVHEAVFARGPAALAPFEALPPRLLALASRLPDEVGESGVLPLDPSLATGLGSVGGGNHFAEVVRVGRVVDRRRAAALGLARDALAVLVHTGSRALGAALADRHREEALEGRAIAAYLADLRGAVRWARANRLLVAYRLLEALSATRESKITGVVDLVHNTVVETEPGRYLHRKGAAPAERDRPTVVLGSRGAPSHVLSGRGHEGCLACVAHGAGRRMGRSEAYAKMRAKHPRKALERTALGGRVICDDPVLMYEEHPDAYKPIEPVIASLLAEGAADPVAELVPLVTVKR